MTEREFIDLMKKNGMKFDDSVPETPTAEGFRLYSEGKGLSHLWGDVSSQNLNNFDEVLQAWIQARDGDYKSKSGLPRELDPALIESMCYRYDHSYGIKSLVLVDGFKWCEESDEQFQNRRDSIRTSMKQLYEEVSGYGFYTYKDNDEG